MYGLPLMLTIDVWEREGKIYYPIFLKKLRVVN